MAEHWSPGEVIHHETIDLTPTWATIAPMLCRVLENPKAAHEAKQVAREEIQRMATAADMWNDRNKQQEQEGN